MSNYILNNTAEEIDLAIGKVANATTTPLDANSNMVTSGGVKAYVDTQVGVLNNSVDARLIALESELENAATGVFLDGTSQYITASESFQTVPLLAQGQPAYFTDNGNNTFTISEGNYLMWFSFRWRTRYDSFSNKLIVQLTTLNGMSDFSGMGTVDLGSTASYFNLKTQLLDATFRYVNQDTTFSFQIRDTTDGSANNVYVKDVTLTILKV